MKKLYLLLTLLILSSCEKDLIIEDEILLPLSPPISLYNESLKNHEFNSGRFDNATQFTSMGVGTSSKMIRRGLVYFDWGNDNNVDVFVNVQRNEWNNLSQWTEYGVLKNKGNIGGVTQWEFDKSMISEQLPYYGSMISQTDIHLH